MLHPSYTDLMNIANSEVEQGEQPVVNSRYSIVLATAKRARQIIAGSKPLVEEGPCQKPLSLAIGELSSSAIKIDTGDEKEIEENELKENELEENEMEENEMEENELEENEMEEIEEI